MIFSHTMAASMACRRQIFLVPFSCNTCCIFAANEKIWAKFLPQTFGIILRRWSSGTCENSTISEHMEDENPREQPYNYDQFYEGHIPTSSLQKGLLAVGSSVMSLMAPWRADMIATMGETTGYQALQYMKRRMQADSTGQQILEECPRINSRTVDLESLSLLPKGTFGRLYSDWLRDNRAHPDARLPVHFIDDPDLAYVMTRYREVHDLIHALLGMPTHMLGEVVVKWVEGLQFRLPLGLSGGLFGAIRLRPKQRQLYLQTHLAYAWNVGLRSNFLLNVYYEHHWQTSVEELRKELHIPEPPDTPAKAWKNS